MLKILQSKILTVFSRDEFKKFKMSIEIKNEDTSSALEFNSMYLTLPDNVFKHHNRKCLYYKSRAKKKPENFEFISNDNKEWPNPELYLKCSKFNA